MSYKMNVEIKPKYVKSKILKFSTLKKLLKELIRDYDQQGEFETRGFKISPNTNSYDINIFGLGSIF